MTKPQKKHAVKPPPSPAPPRAYPITYPKARKLPGERLSSTQTPPDLASIAAEMQAPRDGSGDIVRFPESLPEALPAPDAARLEAVERGQKKLEQGGFWQDIALAILFGAWFVLAWRVFL